MQREAEETVDYSRAGPAGERLRPRRRREDEACSGPGAEAMRALGAFGEVNSVVQAPGGPRTFAAATYAPGGYPLRRRYALGALAFIVMAVEAFASEESFPTALRGMWAETPQICDLLRRSPASVPADRHWLYISSSRVNGTSTGKVIRAINSQSAEATSDVGPSVVMEYAIERGGKLSETAASANTAMQYVRCR